MAKDRSDKKDKKEEKRDKSEKKDRKDKKEKRADQEGVAKVSKKDKTKVPKTKEVTDALLAHLEEASAKPVVAPTPAVAHDDAAEDKDAHKRIVIPKEALVPFAHPLADDKQTKKLLKTVKKAAKHKTLKRGVKEVVKAVRKTTTDQPSSSVVASPSGVVIFAADISPYDVISHIPVLCEDHNIPYIYITSRADLGAAGNTKRPTSVTMVQRDPPSKKGTKGEDEAEYQQAYAELVKFVQKAGSGVKI
ncbi:L30e-like protein [Trichodelitschia bisporula]|uniref:H/ACA ribonucleoprotein complex subunit 2 n=1 Tax=Trichodelitschia bisporula TaxID=703511 RepID=A0A6G1IAL8_9PEZI|nr:L30e-like protein [Trichodelitschia bisporula]